MARRLRLPPHPRGADALHRPLPLAGAVPRHPPAPPDLPQAATLDRFCRPRGPSPASSSAIPTSTTRSTPPRSPAATAATPTARARWPNLMALHGLADRAVDVVPYRTYELGPFEVSFTPSAAFEAAARSRRPLRRRTHLRAPRLASPPAPTAAARSGGSRSGSAASRSTTRAAPT